MSITIRKNNRRKIEEILKAAILIREFRYDDMGDDSRAVQPADVLRAGFDDPQLGFERVYQDGETARFVIHRNWSFTAYASIDAARRSLTPQAFAKYFPKPPTEPQFIEHVLCDASPDHSGQSLHLRIELRDDWILIYPSGYSTADELGGAPIAIERYAGRLRAVLFPDVNDSEAKIVDFEGARETSHCQIG